MKRLLTEAGLGDKEEQEAPRGQQATPVAEGMEMGQCDRSWNEAGGEVSEGRTCCERRSTKPGEKEGKKCLCLSFLFHHTWQGLLLLECPQKPESRGPGGCSPRISLAGHKAGQREWRVSMERITHHSSRICCRYSFTWMEIFLVSLKHALASGQRAWCMG